MTENRAKIWVDADAVPREIRRVILKASQRRRVETLFVANRIPYGLTGPYVSAIQVQTSDDAADDYIVEHCRTGDLVVSADVPLAARVVESGALIIQPRGRVLDAETVRESLSVRDFNEELRSAGHETGGQAPFKPADKMRFANALDRWLTLNGF
ncbi:MAG: DUF188 domain-containing protein [Myxococcota bacterium]|nr:DUF188 domain-containing protein [Myxococcota bacterium]